MKALKTPTFSFRVAAAAALGLAGSLASVCAQTTLTYDADTTAPANDGTGVWNTTSANWYNGTADVLWSNGLTDTAIFGAAAAGTGGTVTVGTVNVGTIQFNPQTTTGYTLGTGTITLGTGITTTNTVNSTISAVIAGTNGLAFTGVAGASAVGVTLSGANTYTGITTLSTGGRITTGSATALGSTVGATASALGANYTQVGAGTTLLVANSTAEAFLINGSGSVASGNPPGALRISNGVTLSSFVQLGSNAQITSNFGTITISGNVDLGAFTLGVGNGSNGVNLLTASGVVTGTSASILDVGAAGGTDVINLTNTANTFSGTTRVNASSGTSSVGLGNDTALGTSTLVFNGGGVQSTSAAARTIANTIGTFTGNAVFGQTTVGTGTLSFTSTTTAALGASRTFTTNVNTTFANGFSGTTLGITKAGTATLFQAGTSSYTGATIINAGTLNAASVANGGVASAIGQSTNAAANLVLAGGTLQYTGTNAQSTDRLFTIAPSTSGPTFSSTIDASGSGTAASLIFSNTGAIAENDLSRAATSTSTTTLTGLASTADLKVGAAVTGTGITAGTTIASITNSTTIVLSQASTSGTAGSPATNSLTFGSVDRSLVLTGTNIGANSVAGVLSDKSATSVLSVSKNGVGTWALSGANTYTGGTSITAGTLLANNSTGSGTGTGSVTVSNAGSVLGGTGTITTAGGVTVNSGAAILGGTGATATGALTLNNTNLILSAGSIVELALGAGAGSAHSTLVLTGTGTIAFDPTVGAGAGQKFTFINLGATTGTYDNIITGLASDPGNESSWTITNAGFTGTFSYDGANIDLNLTAVPIPEPATYLGGVLLVGVAAWGQRKRFGARQEA